MSSLSSNPHYQQVSPFNPAFVSSFGVWCTALNQNFLPEHGWQEIYGSKGNFSVATPLKKMTPFLQQLLMDNSLLGRDEEILKLLHLTRSMAMIWLHILSYFSIYTFL